MKNPKPETLRYDQAFELVLDILCFSYYVENNNLVSDKAFDELEKVYTLLTKNETAPMRGIERKQAYDTGTIVVYDVIAKRKKEQQKNLPED